MCFFPEEMEFCHSRYDEAAASNVFTVRCCDIRENVTSEFQSCSIVLWIFKMVTLWLREANGLPLGQMPCHWRPQAQSLDLQFWSSRVGSLSHFLLSHLPWPRLAYVLQLAMSITGKTFVITVMVGICVVLFMC